MSDPVGIIKDIAVHAVEIKHIQDDMEKLIKEMEEVRKSLAAIDRTLSEAKGGWKTFLAIGGAGAVVVELIQWLVQHIGK